MKQQENHEMKHEATHVVKHEATHVVKPEATHVVKPEINPVMKPEMIHEWTQGRVVGTGNTATVYEWGQGKVLKLFHEGYPREVIEMEFRNAREIDGLDFAKPRVYELVSSSARMGIVYEMIQGESLLDWTIRTRDVQGCAKILSMLHKEILQHRGDNLPGYKGFLKYHIEVGFSRDHKKREEALQKLGCLNEGDMLCHGDFHPGNIILADNQAVVLDFMNVCHGPDLYDVARTVFLVEYTPVPQVAEDREILLNFKKSLADAYLAQMNVTREMIQDYLSVIILARVGECPGETRMAEE